MTHFILLCGGGGTRLWPLSTEDRPKQFLRLLDDGAGGRESLLQRTYRQVLDAAPGAKVTVATSGSYAGLVRGQLGGGVDACLEPCRRDTFPAIALATLRLRDVLGANGSDTVVVCPTDHLVDPSYYACAASAGRLASRSGALTLMGVTPTHASTAFGYVVPEEADASRVAEFREKPGAKDAEALLARGAVWNAGVFAFPLGLVAARAEELAGHGSYEGLLGAYASLERISFDYAVTERERDVRLVRYDGPWSDVGTWGAMADALGDPAIGEVVLGGEARGVTVVNGTGVPVVVDGVADAVVVVTENGVLVTSKSAAADLKPLVEEAKR